ncbi:hypothetical protein J7363_04105 [Phaeobacter italicus]|uniref:hypothetical protein n=1 Tax=Phaeobacter italicus TaxID=481446 RepID=UPI001ADB6B19|nr:hypothetical protein [Phaeobacter italicus]MBO9441266.1 hypothetical protein [Phaeobacter italicus]
MIGFFIDDNAEDRIRIARLLEQKELPINGSFEPVDPIKLRDAILAEKPDLVALDFRLDDEDLAENNYKGGALAQIFREALLETPALDFPIVLVSTEENIKQIYSIDKTSHDLFDQKYMKGQLRDRVYRATCHREILSLAKGYKRIAAALEAGSGVGNLLSLDDDELEIVPLHGFATDLRNCNSVTHVAARMLLRQLIERAGPLLSDKEVAARLGIATERAQLERTMAYMFDAGFGYEGVFGDGWPRIWRHRLEAWAKDLLKEPLTSLSGAERANRLTEAIGLQLQPAVSKWTNSSDELFAFACTTCREPTERRNSLSLYDKYLLPYSEKKRICFDCFIRGEMERFPQLAVDEGDIEVAEDIREGRITR